MEKTTSSLIKLTTRREQKLAARKIANIFANTKIINEIYAKGDKKKTFAINYYYYAYAKNLEYFAINSNMDSIVIISKGPQEITNWYANFRIQLASKANGALLKEIEKHVDDVSDYNSSIRIEGFATAISKQNQGLGTAVINDLIFEYQDKDIYLETYSEEISKLYQTNGFDLTSVAMFPNFGVYALVHKHLK